MRKTAKTNDDVGLDICVRSFCVNGKRAFFYVRVFYPNTQRYSKQILKQRYSLNESKKKRHYKTRIMEVDQSSFAP